MSESTLTTTEIEEELTNVKELYKSGYITKKDYINRVTKLEISKKYSKDVYIPHIDYRFSSIAKYN